MRFIDEAVIKVSGGHGGPGCVSFRRETCTPRGGPDGGDGGDGGDVIFTATHQLGSLRDFRFKRAYHAPNGIHGSGANKAGKDGENILVRVPVGTVIKDSETGEILADLTEENQTWVACEGGRGGKGNTHFTTSTHQAPKFAQPGEEGGSREIKLELKLIADVGIIGFPNAGKSTLISRISAARPKIADYPFTTLTPNLGVVILPSHECYVVADVPGLVEGAHRGTGLGHKFLKHIERTRLFVHLLDGSQLLEELTQPLDETMDPAAAHQVRISNAVENMVKRYEVIRNELRLFSENLLNHPEMVVINKLDTLETDPELIEQARIALQNRIAAVRGSKSLPAEPWVISAVSGKGVERLVFDIWEQLKEYHRISRTKGLTQRDTRLPDSRDIRR